MSHTLPGFNGERTDLLNDTYLPGNGLRTYNPRLMRFACPDSWSPFGAGGMNPFDWCEGDPVNRADPSGHHSLGSWLGIGVGMVLGLLLTPVSGGSSLAVALSVASVTSALTSAGLAMAQQFVDASDPGTASMLGWAALGTGIVSGLSSVALSGVIPGAKSLVSLLKGISDRPIGGLMMSQAMEPSNAMAITTPVGRSQSAMFSGETGYRYMRAPERSVPRLINMAVDVVADNPALIRAAGRILPPHLKERIEFATGNWLLDITGPFRGITAVPQSAVLCRKVLRASQIVKNDFPAFPPSMIWNTDVGRRYLLPLLERNTEGQLLFTRFVGDMADELNLFKPGRQLFGGGDLAMRRTDFQNYLFEAVLPREWYSIYQDELPPLPW